MSWPNYFWKAVWWLTHVGLAPVQAWVTIADAVWSSVKTVLDTWKNLLKTLAYPFTTKTWKPKWKEDHKKTWWKEGFSGRQKDHRNRYVAPFKWDANQAPLLAKATWWIAHFATAIPANAIMTALDWSYSAIKTPFSILKNIWKTVIYPFTTKTWKPTFGKDLKDIWGKEKWFAARTKRSRKEIFDVLSKEKPIWKKEEKNDWLAKGEGVAVVPITKQTTVIKPTEEKEMEYKKPLNDDKKEKSDPIEKSSKINDWWKEKYNNQEKNKAMKKNEKNIWLSEGWDDENEDTEEITKLNSNPNLKQTKKNGIENKEKESWSIETKKTWNKKAEQLEKENEKTSSNIFDNLDTKKISNLEDLVSQIWFNETKKMTFLRSEIVELMKKNWNYKSKYIEYEKFAKEYMEKDEKWKKTPQICLDLIQAYMIKLSWNKNLEKNYNIKIKDSICYAKNMWYDKIIKEIEKTTKINKNIEDSKEKKNIWLNKEWNIKNENIKKIITINSNPNIKSKGEKKENNNNNNNKDSTTNYTPKKNIWIVENKKNNTAEKSSKINDLKKTEEIKKDNKNIKLKKWYIK